MLPFSPACKKELESEASEASGAVCFLGTGKCRPAGTPCQCLSCVIKGVSLVIIIFFACVKVGVGVGVTSRLPGLKVVFAFRKGEE